MTTSKSHGQLHDVAIHRIKLAQLASLSSFYFRALANSLTLFINEDLQYKKQTEVQWKPKLPLAMVLSVGSLFFSSVDSMEVRTFHLYTARQLDEYNRVTVNAQQRYWCHKHTEVLVIRRTLLLGACFLPCTRHHLLSTCAVNRLHYGSK